MTFLYYTLFFSSSMNVSLLQTATTNPTWLTLLPNAHSTKCHKFFIKKAFAVVRMDSNRKASTRRIKTDSLKRPLELRNWLTYAKGELCWADKANVISVKARPLGPRMIILGHHITASSHFKWNIFPLLAGNDERSARARINKKWGLCRRCH